MTLARALAGTAAVAVSMAALVSPAPNATAYWRAAGSATAAVATAGFEPPVVTVPATAYGAPGAGGAVTVSWEPAPGPAPDGYLVARLSAGGTVPVCGTTVTPTSATSCTDVGVPLGRHDYLVTALHRSWTAASGAMPVEVIRYPPVALTVTGPGEATAASADALHGPFTVELQDERGVPAVAPPGGLLLQLRSTSDAAVFAAAFAGAPVSSLLVPEGHTSVTFFYGDTRAGSPAITVTTAALPPVTAAAMIVAAEPAALAFVQQPTRADEWRTIEPPITVEVVDRFGNRTGSTDPVRLSIANPGLLRLGILFGQREVSAVDGLAVFDSVSVNGVLPVLGELLGIDGSGPGYILEAAGAGFTVLSEPFDVD